MIGTEQFFQLSDEQLNHLIEELIEEIKKLQINIQQKQDYLNELLMEIDN